jgi:hypothetical protein
MKFNMKALLDPFSSDPYEHKGRKSKTSKVTKITKVKKASKKGTYKIGSLRNALEDL